MPIPCCDRQFITIGEALNQATRRSPDLERQIAEARKIVDFRNLLTHSYGAVSDAVVWDIIQTSLPRLISDVNALMETADSWSYRILLGYPRFNRANAIEPPRLRLRPYGLAF